MRNCERCRHPRPAEARRSLKFCRIAPTTPTLAAWVRNSTARRGRRDRRDSSRPAIAPGVERRRQPGLSPPRCPQPRWRQWPSLAAAGRAGRGGAVALRGLAGRGLGGRAGACSSR